MLDDRLAKEDVDAFGLISAPLVSLITSLSRFSNPGVVELLKSRDAPGVRGVLAEDPKDANAPDPSPKADDAPFVGEATLLLLRGEMPLNGLGLPLADTSLLKRFTEGYGRGGSDLLLSLFELLALEVERESLVELLGFELASGTAEIPTNVL